jgi:prevent-host-death family protein
VNIHEAKTHLSALLQRVEAGEEIIIARAGEPVAKLVAVTPAPTSPRVPGRWRGRIVIHDSFFQPMSDEELREWEGR